LIVVSETKLQNLAKVGILVDIWGSGVCKLGLNSGMRRAACGLRHAVVGQNNGLKIAKGKQQPKANGQQQTANT
jgi:hypothetical protein